MLYAFVEGLVGIQDKDKLFKRIRICPRWSAAGIEKAEVKVDYKSSGAYVKYIYSQTADKMTIKLSGSYEYVQLSLPVPVNYIAGDLLIAGKKKKYLLSGINKSTYVTSDADISGDCEIILKLKRKTLVRKVN
jgi:hypothetical protein